MKLLESIKHLAEDTRFWVFPLSQSISSSQIETLRTEIATQLSSWNAHGAGVDSEVFSDANQFLLVSALASGAAPSGCSIDQMNSVVRDAVSAAGLTIAPFSKVFFSEESKVCSCERPEFKAMASEGRIGPETLVYDTSVTNAAELRNGWKTPAKNRWHAQLLTTS